MTDCFFLPHHPHRSPLAKHLAAFALSCSLPFLCFCVSRPSTASPMPRVTSSTSVRTRRTHEQQQHHQRSGSAMKPGSSAASPADSRGTSVSIESDTAAATLESMQHQQQQQSPLNPEAGRAMELYTNVPNNNTNNNVGSGNRDHLPSGANDYGGAEYVVTGHRLVLNSAHTSLSTAQFRDGSQPGQLEQHTLVQPATPATPTAPTAAAPQRISRNDGRCHRCRSSVWHQPFIV